MYAREAHDGLEAEWTSGGAEAARQMGGPGRRNRHRIGSPPPETGRHLPVASIGAGSSLGVHRCRRGGGRARDGRSPRRPVGRRQGRRVEQDPTAVRVGGWSHPHRDRRGSHRPARACRRRSVVRPARHRGPVLPMKHPVMRMVLRAALADAVEIGELRRSPAARVGMPRAIAKTDRQRDAEAWTEEELQAFLATTTDHRWGPPLRLCVLYGLRRSELLGLTWSAVDLKRKTVRIEQALIEVHGRPEWSDGKNARSRRTFPLDASTARALKGHRTFQNEERLAAGRDWNDFDLVVATRNGRPVSPGNFDQTLERLVRAAGVRRLTSHGLRHTAATHMVRHATDIGEIRAAADILGHSPDMLMRTYAHALPESIRTVTQRIEERANRSTRSSRSTSPTQ
ncbi:MAG: site-specific integrase [Ilumatobacter sp.]|nr:MAG: site-specific integrase [Ilumatobacter sp.]